MSRRCFGWRWPTLLLVLGLLTGGRPALAESLSVDLSSHLIAITTGFNGTDLTLFGATDGATDGEGDLAVVVEGPHAPITVRRKQQIAGIWTNADSLKFTDAPTYYHVAATRPPSQFMRQAPRARHRLGLDVLPLPVKGNPTPEKQKVFRKALIADRQRVGLYSRQTGNVVFIGNRLFRTDIFFPSNVPTGLYKVRVMLVRGGEVVAETDTPLTVRKIGASAEIYDFAHQDAAVFGILAIIFAASAGWFAAFMFRRN